jgi:CHAD domain-containing protein
MSWRFEPGENLNDAFHRVAGEEIAAACAALQSVDANRDKAIHEARQSFKRLRALLRLAKPGLEDGFDREFRCFRDCGRALSSSREAAVMAETFDRIIADQDRGLDWQEAALLRSALPEVGAAGPDISMDVARVLHALDAARPRLAALAWPETTRDLVRAFRKSQQRLRKSWKKARRDSSSEALHTWRKRIKDQAAQLRLLRQVLPQPLRERRDAQKAIAAELGEDHDLWVLSEHLANDRAPPGTGFTRDRICEIISEKRSALRANALEEGKKFSAKKPRSFARKIGAAWEDCAPEFAGEELRKSA